MFQYHGSINHLSDSELGKFYWHCWDPGINSCHTDNLIIQHVDQEEQLLLWELLSQGKIPSDDRFLFWGSLEAGKKSSGGPTILFHTWSVFDIFLVSMANFGFLTGAGEEGRGLSVSSLTFLPDSKMLFGSRRCLVLEPLGRPIVYYQIWKKDCLLHMFWCLQKVCLFTNIVFVCSFVCLLVGLFVCLLVGWFSLI